MEKMEIAHAGGSLSKVRAYLAKAKLLILDDFGLTPLNGRADLLELLDDRVGSGAMIVNSAGDLRFSLTRSPAVHS